MILMRLVLGAAARGLDDILATGSQYASIPAMQTKDRLYGVLGYVDCAAFDQGVCTGQ